MYVQDLTLQAVLGALVDDLKTLEENGVEARVEQYMCVSGFYTQIYTTHIHIDICVYITCVLNRLGYVFKLT